MKRNAFYTTKTTQISNRKKHNQNENSTFFILKKYYNKVIPSRIMEEESIVVDVEVDVEL